MPHRNQLKFNAVTHPGLKRTNNEDCFFSSSETGLWLIADGMGGHEAGEVASAIVRETLKTLSLASANFSLCPAIETAHRNIINAAAAGTGAPGMGSTVVALLTQQKTYQVAWVGDSRAYLWTRSTTGGDLTRLTRDHSYVQMLLASGAITAEEVDTHRDKHIITQCLGVEDAGYIKVDIVEGHWQPNQWIMLCSDGLTDELNDEQIATILTAHHNSLDAVDQLLEAALASGGRDNITLQIIESPDAGTLGSQARGSHLDDTEVHGGEPPAQQLTGVGQQQRFNDLNPKFVALIALLLIIILLLVNFS